MPEDEIEMLTQEYQDELEVEYPRYDNEVHISTKYAYLLNGDDLPF